MRRTLIALIACAILAAAGSVSAAELDSAGKLRARPGSALLGFDDAEISDWGVLATSWKGNPWEAELTTAPATPTSFGRLGEALAPEGSSAIRLGGEFTGVVIPGSSIIARGGKRFAISFWAKSFGATPYLAAGYSVRKPYGRDFVQVVALRTGRETSDGWSELSTGTIDAAIWDVPLSGVAIALSPWAPKSGGFAIDALEVTPVEGSPIEPRACTQATIETACGPEGDCQYGHCVPGYAAWGPLPPRAHREELVARWVHLVMHVQGDRNAMENAKALVNEGPPLAWYSTSPRPFFSGMSRLVNALRDQHTQFGSPTASLLFPIAHGGGSATTGACFGPGRHDLLASPGKKGDLGYIVFKANKTPPNGVPLERGDALTAIEGEPPLEWMKRVWQTHAGSLPNDPAADLGWSAQGLSWLLEKRASSIEITRCLSGGDCTGANKVVMNVPVGEPLYQKIKGTGSLGPLPGYFWCDLHFKYALDKFAPGVRGENTVSGQIVRGDVLSVHFDGTYGADKWSPSMEALFDPASPPKKVLFDTRQGNGGYGFNAETVVDLLRPRSEPIVDVALPIGAWGGATIATLLKAAQPCIDSPGGSYVCGFADAFATKVEKPIAGDARVAFLNTADVSANDFLARLVKGRKNLKLYGLPTSGAYGSVSGLPAFLLGWGGGSLQMQDSLFADSFAGLSTASFESGKGVFPDVLGAQRMSDARVDRDTLVEAAHAWLSTGVDEGGEL